MAHQTTTPTPGNPSTGNAPQSTAAHTAFGQILHKRLAAPTWSTPIDPSARQAAIENALSMALWHVRRGTGTQSLQAATGRAIRAAAMLKQACSEANTQGRA